MRLVQAANMRPMATMCELVSPIDATRMASEGEASDFARDHALTYLSVSDIAMRVH